MSLRLLGSLNAVKNVCRRCERYSALLRLNLVPASVASAHRPYATSAPPPKGKKFELPEEYTEEVFNALANNPAVMQAMHNVIEAFNRRGITLEKEPSVTDMWKIMRDHQIMETLNQLSKASKAAGIKLDHILKNIPWSQETTDWATKDNSPDPVYTEEGIQRRMNKLKEIMSRPSPDETPAEHPSSRVPPKFEEDQTEKVITNEDQLPLEQIEEDLRLWWHGNEEVEFHEKLAKFKVEKGENLFESDVYDFWVDEWIRIVQESPKVKSK